MNCTAAFIYRAKSGGAQTLAGHHSASFTLDQYADAVPQQLEEAGEKVSTVPLEASGSILVAEAKQLEVRTAQVRYQARPERLLAGFARSSPAHRSGPPRASRAASKPARGLAGVSNSRPSGSEVVQAGTSWQ